MRRFTGATHASNGGVALSIKRARFGRILLGLLVLATVAVLSLALPVSASVYGDGNTPPCGAPLLNGVSFPSNPSYEGSTESEWVSSSICGQARAERLVEIGMLTGLAICLAATTLFLLRRRRTLLRSGDDIFVGGGIIAALISPVLGPLLGLAFAKQAGTRRMLVTQLLANLGFLAGIGAVGLAGLPSHDFPEFPGQFASVAELIALVLLGAAPIVLPLSLLAPSTRPTLTPVSVSMDA